MCLSINPSRCTELGWQNTWESDSQRPRHPRALDNQQLLAIEGYTLGLDVRVDAVRKMPQNVLKKSHSDTLNELVDELIWDLPSGGGSHVYAHCSSNSPSPRQCRRWHLVLHV